MTDQTRKTSSDHLPEVPSAHQVAGHLGHHGLRRPSRLLSWLPLAAIVAVFVLSMTVRHVVTLIVPWLVLVGILAFGYGWRRWLGHLEQRVTRAQELSMMRYHREALYAAWRLLPRVTTVPGMHGRVLTVLAHCLDQFKAYDAAIVAYDGLIEWLPPQHPGTVQLRIQRAIAQLQCGQLLDADDALRGLRGAVGTIGHTVTAAGFCLARLIQQVRTHHYADAVESAPMLLDNLRPLGVEAAYGHALMALSYSHLADPAAARHARMWWSRATLMIPAVALVDRFAELDRLPALNRAGG